MPFELCLPNHRHPGILKRKTPDAGPHPCKHGAAPGDPQKGKPPDGSEGGAPVVMACIVHCVKTTLGHLPSAFLAGNLYDLAGSSNDPNPPATGDPNRKTPEAGTHPCKHGAAWQCHG